MFYYLPPVPKRSQKITLQWSNNSGGSDLSYFSQLFFMPLCFSFIYIFPSLLSQRPRYSCYHTGWRHPWGFFWIGQICANQNTKLFLFRASRATLCSVSEQNFLKSSTKKPHSGSAVVPVLWIKRQTLQKAATSTETCQPSTSLLTWCWLNVSFPLEMKITSLIILSVIKLNHGA